MINGIGINPILNYQNFLNLSIKNNQNLFVNLNYLQNICQAIQNPFLINKIRKNIGENIVNNSSNVLINKIKLENNESDFKKHDIKKF